MYGVHGLLRKLGYAYTLDGDIRPAPRTEPFSFRHRGVAIFIHPDHPPLVEGPRKPDRQRFPPRWLARTSFAGLLNPFWPGNIPLVLKPGYGGREHRYGPELLMSKIVGGPDVRVAQQKVAEALRGVAAITDGSAARGFPIRTR